MLFLGIWKVVKGGAAWFMDAVPTTVKVSLLVTAVLIATHWYAVSYGYDKAKAEQVTIATEKARLQLIANADQAGKQLLVTNRLRAIAAANKAEADRLAALLKEVPKYVTSKADRACTITSGFERVYNSAATGSDIGIPGSGAMDVDEATGIKISDVAAISVENFSECRQRGKVIEAWQEWYTRSKEIFSHAQGIACGTIEVTPTK
ncbi:MAG: hypothetical protein RSE62_03125 [Citrobacter sp.]